jgi:YVTN family beta-propeller protein
MCGIVALAHWCVGALGGCGKLATRAYPFAVYGKALVRFTRVLHAGQRPAPVKLAQLRKVSVISKLILAGGLWLATAAAAQTQAPSVAPVASATRVATAPATAQTAVPAPALKAASSISVPQPDAPLLVLNSRDADVSVIDPKTWQEIKRVPTGKEPHHLYMTPDEKSVIVANALSDSLTFLDPLTGDVQRTIFNILDPYHLRFSPDMRWLVIAANRLNHVDIYRWDGKTPQLAKRIRTGKTPSHISIDSKSTVAYVSMQDSNELVAIDIAQQSIRWRVPTGDMPADVYLTPDDKTLLLGLTASDHVEVWDVSLQPRLAQRIKTGAGAHAFRALGDRRHVLVSNRVANTISQIDLQSLKVVATMAAPGGPDCMDVSKDGKLLYVTSRWAKKLTVIDLATRKVVQQVPVGASPHGVWTFNHAPRE